MTTKTPAQKIATMLEKINELVGDVEIDAKLSVETALAAHLINDVYAEDELSDVDGAAFTPSDDFRAGIRWVAAMLRDHNFDYD